MNNVLKFPRPSTPTSRLSDVPSPQSTRPLKASLSPSAPLLRKTAELHRRNPGAAALVEHLVDRLLLKFTE